MEFRQAVVAALQSALGDDADPSPEIDALLAAPPRPELGDLAFPCFALARRRRTAPPQIALELSGAITPSGPIARVLAAGPYLNFFAHPVALLEELRRRLNDKAGQEGLRTGTPRRTMVEFSQPNTHKVFHVGHLRNVAIGDALVRILRARGHEVVAANYYGDFGIDVAKCLWWLERHPEEEPPPEHRLAYLGEAYAQATGLLEATRAQDAPRAAQMEAEIREILRGMEAKGGPVALRYRETRAWCLEEFRSIYRHLDVRFDVEFFESEVEAQGRKIVDEFLDRGVFEVGERGAVICDLSEEGLVPALVRKSDGTSLYLTWDLALAREKFDRFSIERSLYVVGAEQSLHFQQLFATLGRMGYERAADCRHVSYALVVLPEGKMSSRKGTAVPLHVLESAVREAILGKMRAEGRPERAAWDAKQWDRTVDAVLVACLKYGMLRITNNRQVIFDVEAWTNPEGDTGAYLLYGLARIAGIFRKGGEDLRPELEALLDPGSGFGVESERALLNHLLAYPEALRRVEETLDPSSLASFCHQGVQLFSRFYTQCPVLKAKDPLRLARLNLVVATEAILRQAYDLLGLPILTEM